MLKLAEEGEEEEDLGALSPVEKKERAKKAALEIVELAFA
jgi:hypothetical protein